MEEITEKTEQIADNSRLVTEEAARSHQKPDAQQTVNTGPVPESYFDGNTLQLIGWRLLGLLLTVVTLGIGFPWAQCMIYRWETRHTVVAGKRLFFDGKGHQLLGKYLLWTLLTVVTLGIYAIFIPVSMNKWRAKHTRLASMKESKVSSFSGAQVAAVVLGVIVALLVIALVAMLVTGVFYPKQPTQANTPLLPEETRHINTVIQDPQPSIQVPETTEPTAAVESYYVTAKNGLNLRDTWSTDGTVLALIPYGTVVEPIDWYDGWACVQYGDVTGWCSGNYLSQEDPGPLPTEQATQNGNSGSSTGNGERVYTVEEVKQAIADANAIIASYKGRTPKNGRTSMTAEEVPAFYEKAVGIYDNWMWFCGQFDQQHEFITVTGEYAFEYSNCFIRVTDDQYKTIEDLCEKYYSYLSDDLAYEALSGSVFMLDGNMYAFALGAGVEAVYQSHYHEVSEVGGGFQITTHITECRYPNGWDAGPEYSELVTTNMCILEDGVWVFDGVDTIYT